MSARRRSTHAMIAAAVSGSKTRMTSSSPEILGSTAAPGISYGAKAFAAVAAITAARLAWLAVQPADLYPDEAQYWVWAQHLALGYYSKPPLVAWIIALTTGLFGDSEFAIRLAAPLLHAAAAGFVYATAARLYDRRVGFWSALAYASLPGVSLSAFLISTDAVLLPCWAAALYGLVRARREGGAWWGFVGAAVGLGLLAKYAMAYWLLSASAWVAIVPGERRHWRGLAAAAAVAAVFAGPNLWWNWQHGFVSFLHVRDNAALGGAALHPAGLGRFLASQFGVFGPVFFAGLVALALRPARLDLPAWLLAFFTLPSLVAIIALSLVAHAEPNWAAPAYIAATVLVTAWLLAQGWRRLLAASIAFNLIAAICLFAGSDALAAAGIAVPAKYDPLHRLRSWRTLGDAVSAALAAHPGLTLLADDREVLAALTYYVHPHPFNAVDWSPIPGVSNQWALANGLARHQGEDFLAVTIHGLEREMRPLFVELTLLSTIATQTGPGGGRVYTLYIARRYRAEAKPGG